MKKTTQPEMKQADVTPSNELAEQDLEVVCAGADKITGNLRWANRDGGGGFMNFGAWRGRP
jgi:hypothetical protein